MDADQVTMVYNVGRYGAYGRLQKLSCGGGGAAFIVFSMWGRVRKLDPPPPVGAHCRPIQWRSGS